MKRLILGLVIVVLYSVQVAAQDDIIVVDENGDRGIWAATLFYVTQDSVDIQKIQKRFDRAVIGKDYFEQDGYYYMELEEDDLEEYFELFGKQFYCIPEKKRGNVITIMLMDINGTWANDEEWKL